MIPAAAPVKRAAGAKLMVVRRGAPIEHRPRSDLASVLQPADLVVANDAATLPASLSGTHLPSGAPIEVRLAGWRSHNAALPCEFSAVVFGSGDFRARTEERPSPPSLERGDALRLGPLHATVLRVLDHPRLIALRLDGAPGRIWEGLARHGRPIQYSHLRQPLELWDAWTPLAGPPVAFEPASAAFALSWEILASLPARGVRFATLTHAAGISSTGDPALDARLPFDEPYRIGEAAALAIHEARVRPGRVIAIGTTVVRALEQAGSAGRELAAGDGLATLRIGRGSRLRIVDAVLTGVHERGSSHHELLRAFASDDTLDAMDRELEARDYRTHEFGDSIFVERLR